MIRIRPIVLAAGRGQRLHPTEVKANIELAGSSLLGHILSTLERATHRGASLAAPIVVIGAHAEFVVMRHGEHAAARWVVNDAWRESDMATSLRLGLAADADLGEDDAILVWPVDCPLVRARTIAMLCAAIEGSVWFGAVPSRGAETGHPIVLGPQLRGALVRSEHPHLRALLAAHHGQVRLVEVDDPAVLDNLNTPQALAAAARRARATS